MISEDKFSDGIIWAKETRPEQSIRNSDYWDQFLTQLDTEDDLRIQHLRENSLNIINQIPDPCNWENNASPYNGIVVGAIQSGKTESMIGLSAMAFDQGYNLVVVLTGNDDKLREQTALRFNKLLMGTPDILPNNGFTIPPSSKIEKIGYSLPYNIDVKEFGQLGHYLTIYLENEPTLIVVKKERQNLEALNRDLKLSTSTKTSKISMLVIDDECDEGSVGATDSNNTIPSSIQNIWATDNGCFQVSYVGYTATAAANLLQDPRNPLYPNNFIHLLRYPQGTDSLMSWRHPKFNNCYSGGSIFYDLLGVEPGDQKNFLIKDIISPEEAQEPKDNESLYEALIAFFVSGAYRLAIQEDKGFGQNDPLPEPHCMLVQCSQIVSVHKQWFDSISEMLNGTPNGNSHVFDPDFLFDKMESELELWKGWFNSFATSQNKINHNFRGPSDQTRGVSWEEVQIKLIDMFTHTKLKMINSDDAGSELNFEPIYSSDGQPTKREDTFVIIVGGRKLSRGITIPGLCTTYFCRESIEQNNRPFADSTLQLSRWFGYRGGFIEFCRLFVTQKTYNILLDIHENDIDYRTRLCSIMDSIREDGKLLSDARIALRETPSYKLTAKLGPTAKRYENLSFSPLNKFFTAVETNNFVQSNAYWASSLVKNIKSKNGEELYSDEGKPNTILSRNWKATEIADILDGLSYTDHNPETENYPTPELFKTRDDDREISRRFSFENDPYFIAAYLRYWANSKRFSTPLFNIAIPFGSAEPNQSDNLFNIRVFEDQINIDINRLMTTNPFNHYDQKSLLYSDNPLDYSFDNFGYKRKGFNGLLVLYLVQNPKQFKHIIPTFGISIPKGGPGLQVVTNYSIEIH